MNEKQEFYAATVEDAIEKASADLGIPRDKLGFQVLDQGSTGFLGIGTRDARILVEHSEILANVEALADEDVLPQVPVEDNSVESEDQRETVQPVEPNETAATEDVPEDLIVGVDEFMTALVDSMGLDATVDAYDAGDVIAVDVATRETGLFIGQKGETIDAVQYLVNVAVYKNRPFIKRIVVDSEGYRQRRVEAIQGMAHRTARRALREKRPLELPPMSAAERRVVHLFLKDNPNVTTSSEGKEEERRVVVSPV
jgi:spoIIIJ-associated protein